jgi:hypothetical protein
MEIEAEIEAEATGSSSTRVLLVLGEVGEPGFPVAGRHSVGRGRVAFGQGGIDPGG